MSLSESYTDLSGKPPSQGDRLSADHPFASVPPVDPKLFRLRESLTGILDIAGESHAEQKRIGRVYIFKGDLKIPRETAYATVSERFKPLGYTAMLQREDGEDVVIAIEGGIPMRQIKTRPLLHLLLLLVTIVTTTIMGAALTGMPTASFIQAIRDWDMTVIKPAVRDSLPFSLTLLGILGVHEMGHYVAARLHGIKVTLPFFIPLPIPHSLGTMGAVIFIRSPLMNRRALFDVGVAGPLAGLVVAIPLFLYGIQMTPTVSGPDASWLQAGIRRVSNPPLLEALAPLVQETNNLDRLVFYNHPMALAAWFGVLLTSLNLLPIGQFDGGHVSYALFGQRAWPLAGATFLALLMLGLFGAWFAWLIWAFMGLLTGLRHPPPHDDLTPLGLPRTIIGLLTILLFFLIITPVPFYSPT